VIIWLGVGLIMIFLQIIIGGITRLTGSGLSITEWDIVTGSLPPISDAAWMIEYEKYQLTPQYRKINSDMEMGTIFTTGTFKFIYFWEYLHRLWARLMGVVFIVPFVFFYIKGLLPRVLVKRLGVVILLAALAATFGWIMVASGLVDKPWVNAYKLSLHLCIGISVFMALWWAYIHFVNDWTRPYRSVTRLMLLMLVFISFQIFIGGVMSGTKAALFINTWPDYHGLLLPQIVLDGTQWTSNNFSNYESSGFLVSLIQVIHRTLGYIIFCLSCYMVWLYRSDRVIWIFMILIMTQVLLGILTLVKSVGFIPVDLGVYHQGVAVLILSCWIYFMMRYRYMEE